MNTPVEDADATATIADTLRTLVPRGQVRFGRHDRLLYATDASIYQVEPLGVVVPADAGEVAAVVGWCGANRVPLLPRGGGTSLAGQCTARAVVLDLSALCRRVISVDVAARVAHVETGITIEELNRELIARKSGLFYAPDPATVAQAAVGGTIGNNAAGARSIRYGRTSENIAALDVILSSGERVWLEAGAGRRDPVALRLARAVAGVCREHADEIRARFPKTVRRNAGYGLDMIVSQLDAGVADEDLDLTGLICGSEGTLAVVVGAKLKLHPIPVARGLSIVSFATLEEAIDSVSPILTTRPTAVELIDQVVLEAAANNLSTKPLLELLPPINRQMPRAVLYVEHSAEASAREVAEGFEALRRVCPDTPICQYTDADALGRAWALRKAGEPLLHGIAAHRKPQTFVEDNAIPVGNLPRFVREFQKIVARHGTTAAYWAHASVGVLHVRPLVDVHDEGDRKIIQSIAVEVADLARACGGVMSGEHGDGKIRGPLLERFFGAALMRAFRQIKAVFDPAGVLNPDNIVSPGPVQSITERLRVLPEVGREVRVPSVQTFYSYDDQHGFEGAVEMCNGAGLCRKTSGGTMCPSYRATLDERHATRGRGNALRMAITGQVSTGGSGAPAWDDPGTIATLDLCLSCKACKSECPSNVDVARLKAEYTAQRYRDHGAPLAAKAFGHVRALNRLGSLMPDLANWINEQPFVRAVMNKVLGLAPARSIPPFGESLYRWFQHRQGPPSTGTASPVVILYADCFATYNEPHVGQAAVQVLEACGYEVRLPRIACCGRAMISTGLLPDAIASADRALATLVPELADPRVHGVVVCEPSCLSAIKDDWLQLKCRTPLDVRTRIASASWMVEEFVDRFWDQHPVQPTFRGSGAPVLLHGHCHQKALWGDDTSARALRRAAGGSNVTVLPSGCCGMAGSFGYIHHRYDLSMRIGELSVFPPVRSSPGSMVVAPGTSCRHQIKDGTGRQAIHPVELLASRLA